MAGIKMKTIQMDRIDGQGKMNKNENNPNE